MVERKCCHLLSRRSSIKGVISSEILSFCYYFNQWQYILAILDSALYCDWSLGVPNLHRHVWCNCPPEKNVSNFKIFWKVCHSNFVPSIFWGLSEWVRLVSHDGEVVPGRRETLSCKSQHSMQPEGGSRRHERVHLFTTRLKCHRRFQ